METKNITLSEPAHAVSAYRLPQKRRNEQFSFLQLEENKIVA